ncbi:nicotinate phosphoribosyltransferase-like protein [Apodospora peruviana]|uniref:nicotinate phosphoribosyltransferase n=1 Tax=Apodospora peruviana TaxID=516989 RepID=A0AAE0MFU6_9PEZI|nr:nicotinate phosphoribosyltransferase-like protein [Apodospora peruviana]
MDFNSSSPYPEGVISFLDTDLYKLTMQCAVLKYYKDVPVTYSFTNRTPEKKLSRKAFQWLEEQIRKLGNISLSAEEHQYLKTHCPYLTSAYLEFLQDFRLRPREQVVITFLPVGKDTGSPSDIGDIHIAISGTWSETILYEIPLLALTSEAYFKYMDPDWTYDGQEEKAFEKGIRLLEAGCVFSEFGTRRRRDYHTQALVFRGLTRASKEAEKRGFPGKLSGTSNVHLAMRFGIPPVGTVAHEWFMGIAAIIGDYKMSTEEALCRWVGCFGEGVLGIALTDTFGTPEFLKAFSKPVRHLEKGRDPAEKPKRKHSIADTFTTAVENLVEKVQGSAGKTYAEVFTGVRQDSGDPKGFVKMMRKFYDEQGIRDKKVIVFSDSLNIDRCLEYKQSSEEAGFQPTFGVGTFLTNDFVHTTTGKKSTPLNIVIKLSSAGGQPAIKISDNAGKNTGDKATVDKVKRELGYVEKDWVGGDETARWGREGDAAAKA